MLSMLRLVSRFVLEVLPYALSALIAAIQPARATDRVNSAVGAPELVRGDHAVFAELAVSTLSSGGLQRRAAGK
jgi:hypothetical protein